MLPVVDDERLPRSGGRLGGGQLLERAGEETRAVPGADGDGQAQAVRLSAVTTGPLRPGTAESGDSGPSVRPALAGQPGRKASARHRTSCGRRSPPGRSLERGRRRPRTVRYGHRGGETAPAPHDRAWGARARSVCPSTPRPDLTRSARARRDPAHPSADEVDGFFPRDRIATGAQQILDFVAEGRVLADGDPALPLTALQVPLARGRRRRMGARRTASGTSMADSAWRASSRGRGGGENLRPVRPSRSDAASPSTAPRVARHAWHVSPGQDGGDETSPTAFARGSGKVPSTARCQGSVSPRSGPVEPACIQAVGGRKSSHRTRAGKPAPAGEPCWRRPTGSAPSRPSRTRRAVGVREGRVQDHPGARRSPDRLRSSPRGLGGAEGSPCRGCRGGRRRARGPSMAECASLTVTSASFQSGRRSPSSQRHRASPRPRQALGPVSSPIRIDCLGPMPT